MSDTTCKPHHHLIWASCLLLAACSGDTNREVHYGDITRTPELVVPAGLDAPDNRRAMELPRQVDHVATSKSAGLLIQPPQPGFSGDGEASPEAGTAPGKVERARIEQGVEGAYISLDEGFARAWRHTGIALTAVGLVVDDRDRSKGLYYVSIVSQEQPTYYTDGGLLGDWLDSPDDEDKDRVRRRVQLLRADDEHTFIYLFDDEDRPLSDEQGRPLLELLAKQLN